MTHSEQLDKLAPALVAAQAEMGKVTKAGRNDYDKYDYARLEDFVAVAGPVLAKHGLAMVSGAAIAKGDVARVTKKGNHENGTYVELDMVLLHESGQWLSVTSTGEGQDRADKGTYKAITGARKYGVAMVCGLVTTDDPEADETVGVEGVPARKVESAAPGGNGRKAAGVF